MNSRINTVSIDKTNKIKRSNSKAEKMTTIIITLYNLGMAKKSDTMSKFILTSCQNSAMI